MISRARTKTRRKIEAVVVAEVMQVSASEYTRAEALPRGEEWLGVTIDVDGRNNAEMAECPNRHVMKVDVTIIQCDKIVAHLVSLRRTTAGFSDTALNEASDA